MHVWWDKILCWISDLVEQEWYLHHSIQIYQGDIEEFGMEDSRPVRTPMSTRHKLSKNDDSKEVDQTIYRSTIGKL